MNETLRALLIKIGREDLLPLVGNVSAGTILKQVLDRLPPNIRAGAKMLIEKEEQAQQTQTFLKQVRDSSPAKFPQTLVIEAMLKGVHPQTYVANKALPLKDKLALPVWEAIFALNYKDKDNGKTSKTPRNRGKRI